jgi:beta-lactamase regulating signal transducer with metallopeptidase domain
MGFFYSFIETIIHSLWQAGLLALVYVGIQAATKQIHPLQKRNVLYSLLAIQFFASISTFYIYNSEKNIGTFLQLETYNWLAQYAYVFFYCYITIVIIRFSALLSQWNSFKFQYKRALVKPTAEHKIFTSLKAHQLGIKRKVSIWYSHHVQVPITFGFLKPIILLPFSLINHISPAEAETIILHELAHIKSKDYLLNWLLVTMEIVFFFNPFVKILIEKLKIEREKNCDIQVIHFAYDELLYAPILLKIAKNNNRVQPFQMGAVRKTSQLLQRIRFFSNEENFYFKKYSTLLLFLLLPIVMMCTLFLLPAHKQNIVSPANNFSFFVPKKIINIQPENEIAFGEKASSTITTTPIIEPTIAEKNNTNDIPNQQLIKSAAFEYDNMYQPVSLQEIPDSTKEFIYNIETPEGKIMQSYKLIFVNGKWILQPQWMITEINADTSKNALIDTMYNYTIIDSIQ